MAANDCWNAFGSDSESDDEDCGSGGDTHHVPDPFEPAADATALAITQRFVSLTKSSGVLPKERVVGIGSNCNGEEVERWRTMLMERVGGRGMQVVGASAGNALGDLQFDAAILLGDDGTSGGGPLSPTACIKRALVPGGLLWLVRPAGGAGGIDAEGRTTLEGFDEATWDVASSSVVYSSPDVQVISVQKRACTINAWSCRWMDKEDTIGKELCSEMAGGDFAVLEDDTYLQYERRVASAVTVSPSVAERRRIDATSDDESDDAMYSTILTDASVQRATTILRQHGFAVIKGLLFPEQTIPWGNAVLSDFESAVSRLRQRPTRPVDLLNPRTGDDGTSATEPRNYKEVAMREDLRVDLRSGPEMERLRRSDNVVANLAIEKQLEENSNDGPTIVDADNEGTTASWRFHPSILAIIKSTFNPRNESLYKGNFGRWNFSGGGRGPDGSPQPFRLGQVGSVLSCPGSADQAIHADTPHLFEHLDCLPCHYCNVFTPGYEVIDILDNQCYQNEFNLDGIWTGNSTMGGTAFVQGSHKLSVTTQLLAEDDADDEDKASRRRKLLQLRTIRPALEAGDVLIFDCRTIHYGLANTSPGDPSGKDANAGRRPMLYLNVSQSWFHDPKNWNDRESIFD
ncbi:hypothetical protein ACHAXT_003944 [Thalassiosira profunda]